MIRLLMATLIAVLYALPAASQTAEADVRRALEEGNRAALAKDVTAYGRFLADDLRWLQTDGSIHTKAQRLAAMPSATNTPKLIDADIKVFGDVALVVVTQGSANGRGRAARTLVRRDGRWQLALHAQVPLPR